MASVDDQYEYGRIPLKPLPYSRKEESQCNEIMIDYGEEANYHIYIVHHADDTKYIDITSLIIKEMLPKADINADQFIITIEGEKNPSSLMDIINFIWKRFPYAEDPSGFVPERDMNLIFSPTTKNILLRTTDGTIQLPITSADNVYDKSGKTIQERLDDMVRLGFSISYLYTTEQNQTTYEFDYPFEDYPDFMEVRIGTTYVDKSRYTITKHYDSNRHYKSGTLTFIGEAIENGRRIDLLWLFNSAYNPDGKLEFISGSIIADGTIPTCKLEKSSNSFIYDDSSSVATSKGLHDLYVFLTEAINSDSKNGIYYCIDEEKTQQNIILVSIPQITDGNTIKVGIATDKISQCALQVNTESGKSTYDLITPDGKMQNKKFKANQMLTLKISGNHAVIIEGYNQCIRTNKKIYTCKDQEYEIPFKGLAYYDGDLIHVYRNGVRLFEDLDYSINYTNEIITLYVRTEDRERIVFEALGI